MVKKNVKSGLDYLPACSFLLLLILLLNATCIKTTKYQTVSEPLSIVLLDESRIENMRARHIFKQILLRELVKDGRSSITVNDLECTTDSINFLLSGNIKYLISFDLMDYSNCDVDKGTEKLLVSVKILQGSSRVVKAAFVETDQANNVDQVCYSVAAKLAKAITNRLRALQTYVIFDSPELPQDSL